MPGFRRRTSVVQNALGSDATQYADAQADITKGATVLAVDPLDSGVGAKIESYAKSHGVPVIDYDRLTLGGTRKYYVSFNNVYVGTLLGKGLVSCIAAWHVMKPEVMVMHGAPTDNNATLFADGYDAVLAPYFANKTYTDVVNPAGTWTPSDCLVGVPGGVHGAPERQRRADAERRERRADHPLPADAGHQGGRPSRSPARTPPSPGCRTSSPGTSAAPCTSRSTWRHRPRPRWPCTCERALLRRRRWSTAM